MHIAKKLFKDFCNDPMKSNAKSFHSTIHHNHRCNFNNPPAELEGKKKQLLRSEAMENKAMTSVISLAEADGEMFDLFEILDYRVTDECLSIFNVNGRMIKTQKSGIPVFLWGYQYFLLGTY